MKSEKGMTLLTTVILVVIIAALVFAVVYYIRIAYAKENLESLKTDMLLIQAKIKKIAGEYTLSQKTEDLKGTKIADMKEDEIIKQFLDKEIIDIDEKGKLYYVLNQEDLVQLELNKTQLEENTYYIAEYTTNEVYYTKGVSYTDGNTYYKISEIENLQIEEKSQQEKTENDETKNDNTENEEKKENSEEDKKQD